MNRHFLIGTLAAAFLVIGATHVQAQTRQNANLYRQNLIRTSPQPLTAYRGTAGSAVIGNNFIPGVGFVNPLNTYVNPAVNYPGYFPNYYSNPYPGFYPNYYSNPYPGFYPSYNPYSYSPGYVNPGFAYPFYGY
jgi:hypothetical protein